MSGGEADGLAALRALLAPATQRVEVRGTPRVRQKPCRKCPFGDGLDAGEQLQADALKARLANEPDTVWGCHETANGPRPAICAGFARWKAKRNRTDGQG